MTMWWLLSVAWAAPCPMALNASQCEVKAVAASNSKLIDEAIFTHRYFPDEAKLVAFASFPHSGNSWLRALYDSLTGYEIVECIAGPETPDFYRNNRLRSIMVKTHRSPTYKDAYPKACPIYFSSKDRKAVPPAAVLHLVRNPIDSFYSIGIARKDFDFDPKRGFWRPEQTRWLTSNLQHLEYWTVHAPSIVHKREPKEHYRFFRLRYEDALADPPLALRAIQAFLWRAHRPEERSLIGPLFNDSQLDAALATFTCANTGSGKCLTGGAEHVGAKAACLAPQWILPVSDAHTAVLDRLGYAIRSSPDCPQCREQSGRCTCSCPLELIVKHDKLYSGIVNIQGDVVLSLADLVQTTAAMMR